MNFQSFETNLTALLFYCFEITSNNIFYFIWKPDANLNFKETILLHLAFEEA